MDPARLQEIERLYHAALEREVSQRATFLREICGGNEALIGEVESLLAYNQKAEDFIEVPALELAAQALALDEVRLDPTLPARIGHYRISRLLGEGGMGRVYEAEQEHPRRIVALKVIKPGLTHPKLLRRFEQESQALGRLQHPGIAQIYEAGTADSGFGPQPYFAMEFIRGESLLQYAESHQLNTRQRLEIVAKVCEAVHHAHQRGIIHRDLKPGNIVVDENGQPKILDLGVARVTDRDAQATLQTDMGLIVGTLAYMSPEQVLGDPLELDTRSDVYALGVILFELLAGRLPYKISSHLHEAAQTIRAEAPEPLSRVSRAYRGDIETIVVKALEKDKARRYASAAGMAMDLRCYLTDEPITARPPSARYQLQKFARRHKAQMAGVAAVFIVFIAGIIGSTWEATRARQAEHAALAERDRATLAEQAATKQLDRALSAERSATAERNRAVAAETQSIQERNRAVAEKQRADTEAETARAAETQSIQEQNRAVAEKQRADTEAATARAVNDFLRNDLLAQAGADTQARPNIKPDPDLKVRTALDRAAARIAARFNTQPLVEASIRQTIGNAYNELGLYPDAQRHLERALALQNRILGESDPITLSTMYDLANDLYRYQRKLAQAEPLFIRVLETRRRVLGDEDPLTLETMNRLGDLYRFQGKDTQAEALLSEALAGFRRVLGEDHPWTLDTMNNLALVRRLQNKDEEAEALLSKSLEGSRRLLGEEHPETLIVANNLAVLYLNERRYAEAEPLFTNVLEVRRRVLGEAHSETRDTMTALVRLYYQQGKYEEAESLFSQSLERSRRMRGEEHPETLIFTNNLAALYQRERKYAEAERLFSGVLEIRRRVLGEEHQDTQDTLRDLARLYYAQGKYAQAETLATEVLEVTRRLLGPEHPTTLFSMNDLVVTYRAQSKYAQAEILSTEVLEVRRRVLGAEHPNTLTSMNTLSGVYRDQGKYAQAETLSTEVLEIRRRVLGAEHPNTLISMNDVALLYLNQRKYADAMALLREAMNSHQKNMMNTWTRYNCQSLLGASLAGEKKYADAEPLLLSGYEGMLQRQATMPDATRKLAQAGEWIVQFYQDSGKPEKAAVWTQKLQATTLGLSKEP
jgi:tetratricopeptide (TPR) repeat protein